MSKSQIARHGAGPGEARETHRTVEHAPSSRLSFFEGLFLILVALGMTGLFTGWWIVILRAVR